MKKLSAAFLKTFLAAMSSFVLFTLNWILWGLLTPGDFFGNGSPLIYVTAVAAAVAGFIVGFRIKSKAGRKILIFLGIGCLIFWLFAPNGWWAVPPPMPHHIKGAHSSFVN